VVIRRIAVCIALGILLTPAALPQTTKASTSSKKKAAPSAAAKKLKHIHHAFVASADLKPMARQLLEERTPQAYAGVESYARKHAAEPDAAALAWLVVGYAHYTDKDYVHARAAWQHAGALEPVLGDYLAWLRASAFQGEGNPAGVLSTLETFEQKYPDSLNLHDVQLLYAGALSASGQPLRAVEYLEKRRTPYRPDLELLLAKAYSDAGAKEKSIDVLRRIYFEQPLAMEADVAAVQLRSLGAAPEGNFDQRHARAEALLKGKRFREASNELSLLVELAPTEKMADLQLDYGSALYRDHRHQDAQRVFENVLGDPSATTEQKAQALYFLGEVAREKDDRERQAQYITQLRSLAPGSNWFQEALLSAGNSCSLRRDFDCASRFYGEIYQSQQNGRYAATAHWKTAWLMYRMGKKDEARRLFDEQLELYPNSAEAPAALYWRGRLTEDLGDKALARAYYQKLCENYRFYYYANLGRERLAALGLQEVSDPPLLNKLRPPSAPPNQGWDAPDSNLRAQKARLLANAALYDFAIRELQAATPGTPPWQAKAIASVYQEQGSYIHAIETLKRALPSYFSADISQLPRPVWEGLFPRAYWDELKRNCQKNGLDPYLVASLIRQESEFNPGAISRANAMGLMQLLPSVGKSLAKQSKMKRFSRDQLLEPGTNLQLGTLYFRKIVDHYDGGIAYALAAYNAGENRVADWRKSGDFKDVEEFVESIPFTETREYVQAILRNAVLYRLLYPKS
jgi:soluble lytic murein transglycosylase